MKSYWNVQTFSQPSAQELKRRANASLSSAKKKGQLFEPVLLPERSGRTICRSWWGQAWCRNLERYADFASRIERGKRYVRTGTVVDLKIRGGRVEARVQGSRKIPYKVGIRISPLSETKCQSIIDKCGRRIESLEKLAAGEFPEELKELFLEDGLFPSPREISFDCSCPDWALMCKHVAAAMYGIGVRLDENPFYFFVLRGIDIDRFIALTLENKVEEMLKKSDRITERVIEDADLTGLFGL